MKPILIFDGDCGFCRTWISRWKEITGSEVVYEPYQNVGQKYPQVPLSQFQESVVLVLPNGEFFVAAEAVFRVLAIGNGKIFGKLLYWVYSHCLLARWASEGAYRLVASNRVFFSKLTRFFYGDSVESSTFFFSRWLYFRLLGLLFLIATGSLWVQYPGLVGPHGIIPSSFSEGVASGILGIGVFASLGLILGVFPLLTTFVSFASYWYLTLVFGEFLWFQWDGLLLEMGFLSLFLCPWVLFHQFPGRASSEPSPYRISLFLLKWLLFRVVFFSGWVKLASGDPHWRDLTALSYHFETQPLPTWLGWYFHQLPEFALQGLTLGMFFFELGFVFLIFAPRRFRNIGFVCMVLLQILIDATGNYGFFGWQVVTLSFLLIDDITWKKVLWRFPNLFSRPQRSDRYGPLARYAFMTSLGVFLFVTTFAWTRSTFLRPLWESRLVNSYGVFAVMTTKRYEIIFEGSQDGENWKEYELYWKPGDLTKAPRFVEPFMPRLDWQLWFAALSNINQNPWVYSTMEALLRNEKEVLKLFRVNPFLNEPPRYLRASLYRYRFTDGVVRHQTGQWWERAFIAIYAPVIERPFF